MQHREFDVIVVGSSPILILFALQTRRLGKTVCIVEQDKVLGGAWSVDRYNMNGKEIDHENACHLIEWYLGGYELLERLSSVPFGLLSPQPVRVWKNGRIAPYTSRLGILVEYVLSWRAIAYGLVKMFLAYAGVAKYPRSSATFQLRESIARMAMDTRYRLPGIVLFDGVRAPTRGFADFVFHLSEELGRQGITVLRHRANGITRHGNDLRVAMVDGDCVSGRCVIVGESSLIQSVGGKQQHESILSPYYHVLISLPSSDTVIRNSYVHFPDHEVFHRITYIEDVADEGGELVSLFLLQLRVSVSDIVDIVEELDKVCRLYRIAVSARNMKIRKNMEAMHLSSPFHSGWAWDKKNDLMVLRTIGDLSRNAIVLRRRM